jgi:predicted metal-dependent HD superfamily phosphohydrolase
MSAQSSSSAAFRAALTHFESTLNPDELARMKISSLTDVYDAIREIQQKQGSDKKLQNLNRIKAFLEGMKQYEQLVKVFLNVSSFVAFIWVSDAAQNRDKEAADLMPT